MEKVYYRGHSARRGFLFRYLSGLALVVFGYVGRDTELLTITQMGEVGSYVYLFPVVLGLASLIYMEASLHVITFSITSRAIVRKFSFIKREVSQIPINRVEKFHLSQSVIGRILNVGDLVVWGEDNLIISFEKVSSPQKIQFVLNRLNAGHGKVDSGD